MAKYQRLRSLYGDVSTRQLASEDAIKATAISGKKLNRTKNHLHSA
jgi:hypothetical protein